MRFLSTLALEKIGNDFFHLLGQQRRAVYFDQAQHPLHHMQMLRCLPQSLLLPGILDKLLKGDARALQGLGQTLANQLQILLGYFAAVPIIGHLIQTCTASSWSSPAFNASTRFGSPTGVPAARFPRAGLSLPVSSSGKVKPATERLS
ncbi:hypothetical protein MnTg04_00978 [bacterium MnTg04]|nr:hypothetical protein MnTg04_00978 [bacterium MnTg04]